MCGIFIFELIVLFKYENFYKVLFGLDMKDCIKDNQVLFGLLLLEEVVIVLIIKIILDGFGGKGLFESFEVVLDCGSWMQNIYDSCGCYILIEICKEWDVFVDGIGLCGLQYIICVLNNVILIEIMFFNLNFGINIFVIIVESFFFSRGQFLLFVIVYREIM